MGKMYSISFFGNVFFCCCCMYTKECLCSNGAIEGNEWNKIETSFLVSTLRWAVCSKINNKKKQNSHPLYVTGMWYRLLNYFFTMIYFIQFDLNFNPCCKAPLSHILQPASLQAGKESSVTQPSFMQPSSADRNIHWGCKQKSHLAV